MAGKKRKTHPLQESKRQKQGRSIRSNVVMEAYAQYIDKGCNPGKDLLADGYHFYGMTRVLHAERFRMGASHLKHLFALFARGFTAAEIVQELSVAWFDFEKIADIGWERRASAENRKKQLEALAEKSLQSDGDPDVMAQSAMEFLAQANAVRIPAAGDHLREMYRWLRDVVYQAINRRDFHRWHDWAQAEKQAYEDAGRQDITLPMKCKNQRIMALQRLYDRALTEDNLDACIKILKALKDEAEGTVQTHRLESADRIADDLIKGTIKSDEFAEIKNLLGSILNNRLDTDGQDVFGGGESVTGEEDGPNTGAPEAI